MTHEVRSACKPTPAVVAAGVLLPCCDWFHTSVPASRDLPTYVMDGDLPKAEWLVGEQSELLSDFDGETHTVIAGRRIGPSPEVIGHLASHEIHVHVYSEKAHAQMKDWVDAARRVAPGRLHLHAQVDQEDWVREFLACSGDLGQWALLK